MKKATVILLLLLAATQAAAFHFPNLNIFGSDDKQRSRHPDIDFGFYHLPDTPDVPVIPVLPLDPLDPGIPVIPVTPVTPQPVPEPPSGILLLTGIVVLAIAALMERRRADR